MGKSGVLTPNEQQIYVSINSNRSLQRKSFEEHKAKLGDHGMHCDITDCKKLGLALNTQNGCISYSHGFKPLNLSYEICYVRHGKTEGNTEPRVFQGRVDYNANQLNDIGRKQAELAANRMELESTDWNPQLIISSPLQRSIATGHAFHKRHTDIPFIIESNAAEMAFGNWDNCRVIDIPSEDIAHLFYLEQNVIVKAPEPHVVQEGWYMGREAPGNLIPSESFIDVLTRMKNFLTGVENLQQVASGNTTRVILYGHSMAGAAVSILMGHGSYVDNTDHLGFDGRYIMPNATPKFFLPQNPET